MKAVVIFLIRVALPVLPVVHSPEVQLICKMICLMYLYTWSVYIQGGHTFLEGEIVRLTVFNNSLIHNYVHYSPSCAYERCVLVFEGEENRSNQRKTLEAHLTSHGMQVQALTGLNFFPW